MKLSYVKLILCLAAILVTLFSLWASHILTQDLKDEERRRVEIWAAAMKSLTTADQGADMTLVLQVLESNHTIPVIVADAEGRIIDSRNLPSSLQTAADTLEAHQSMQRAGHTMRIDLGQTAAGPKGNKAAFITVSYGESQMIQRLTLYPYIQLGIVALLVAVAIYALLSSKRAEQNKVWVGLSRETAHQLGTPISSLTAWSQLLKANYPDDPILDDMETDLMRLRLIAERFSKIGSAPELSETDLGEAIDHTVQYISRRTSDRVRMHCSLPSEHITARINAPLFEWVIENLCKNAIDAMSGEGEIRIYVFRERDRIVIQVSDTGRGIPTRHVRDVFRPGFTTKKRGWGLGLSLARRIIEQYHMGRIFVERSEVGVGTTFRIELPRNGRK